MKKDDTETTRRDDVARILNELQETVGKLFRASEKIHREEKEKSDKVDVI